MVTSSVNRLVVAKRTPALQAATRILIAVSNEIFMVPLVDMIVAKDMALVVVVVAMKGETESEIVPCIFMSKLQVLSFMFTPNCRRCPLAQKFASFVLYVSKSCTF
ncbi:hypothetical protein Hanom_Chr16g01461071 [Helianthus anomalus]